MICLLRARRTEIALETSSARVAVECLTEDSKTNACNTSSGASVHCCQAIGLQLDGSDLQAVERSLKIWFEGP